MPVSHPERFIEGQVKTRLIAEIKDCTIGVDASHYCNIFLSKYPYQEPLLPALGGLTGIAHHLERDLDLWKENNVTPLFVFDGQPLTGQEDVALRHGLEINARTNAAWDLYFDSKATDSVHAFSAISGAWRPQALYPLLKRILSQRRLRFLVAPYNASAQLAHMEMTDADLCSAIMGSQELLLYPIPDIVLQTIDWEKGIVTYLSKRGVLDALRAASSNLPITEPFFVDSLLMMGTSFLPTFPPLLNKTVYRVDPTILDVFPILRASEKSVAKAAASFQDVLTAQEPDWLDMYQKARMAVHHYIYINSIGEVKVNDWDHLTKDNHEYLGLQMPPEVFHYLNIGMISERIPSYITHCQVTIQPTLDGVNSAEYRALVADHVVPTLETALSLVLSRIHRGIAHMDIHLKAWYDPKLRRKINPRNVQPPPAGKVATWTISGPKLSDELGKHLGGPIAFEVLCLLQEAVIKRTIAPKGTPITGIDDPDNVVSVVIWRWLHLRGYIKDNHELSRWGTALGRALVEVLSNNSPEDAAMLNEPVLMAFELMRLGLLNNWHLHEELYGLPLNGSAEDKTHVLLLGRMATLIRMRHMTHGYTGPLNKNLLAFRSLSSAVREANRDLIEAILLSMFLNDQSERDREDGVEIAQKLPFVETPDIAMGIAVKTFLDDLPVEATQTDKETHLHGFQGKFFPFATHLAEDLELCWKLFDALVIGVNALDTEMSAADKATWNNAARYLKARR
jgi:hypothetical protein